MREASATVSHERDVVVIRVSGYVSRESSPELERALAQADADRTVLAFDDDCFIDSTGLAALMAFLLPAKAAGRAIRLVHPRVHFRRVFDVVGLSGDFEVFADLATAARPWPAGDAGTT